MSRMVRPATLHTDIYHLIVSQMALQHDSLLNLAASSSLLGDIARGHLFKRVRIDVHRPDDAVQLLQVIQRDPRVANLIRHLEVADSVLPPLGTRPHPALGYALLGDNTAPLARLLAKLENVHTVSLSFRYQWQQHDAAPLQWRNLSRALQALVLRSEVRTVYIEGIRLIPLQVSTAFLYKDALQIKECTFAPDLITSPLDVVSAATQNSLAPSKSTLTTLEFTWLAPDAVAAAKFQNEILSIAHHWIYAHVLVRAPLPPVSSLSIALASWSSIADAALLLRLLQGHLTRVKTDTRGMHLEALQLLPVYTAAREDATYPTPLVALGNSCIPLLAAQGVPVLPSGWLSQDLAALALPASQIKTVEYSIAYWATTIPVSTLHHVPLGLTGPANSELAWVCSALDALPLSRAAHIETIVLQLTLGNHMLSGAGHSNSLGALAVDGAWTTLAGVLGGVSDRTVAAPVAGVLGSGAERTVAAPVTGVLGGMSEHTVAVPIEDKDAADAERVREELKHRMEEEEAKRRWVALRTVRVEVTMPGSSNVEGATVFERNALAYIQARLVAMMRGRVAVEIAWVR